MKAIFVQVHSCIGEIKQALEQYNQPDDQTCLNLVINKLPYSGPERPVFSNGAIMCLEMLVWNSTI